MPKSKAASSMWDELIEMFTKVISDVDERAAAATVKAMRDNNPEETVEQIIERLIRDKCLKTAGIGAASAAAAIIPGIGTAASLTVGLAADIGATFKLQAELVLEIAAARNYTLSDAEKRTAVMTITGVSSGANQALRAASTKALTLYAEKWVAHALPVVGVGASAALNALTTYIVGQRANAYFALGSDPTDDIYKMLIALTGVDPSAVGGWLSARAVSSWESAKSGASIAAGYVGDGASAAGGVVASGASAAGTAFVDGASAAANYVTASVNSVGSTGRWSAEMLASYAKGGIGAVGSAGSWVSGSVAGGASAVKRRLWSSDETTIEAVVENKPPVADDASDTPSSSDSDSSA